MAVFKNPDLRHQPILAAEFGNVTRHTAIFERSAMAVGDNQVLMPLPPGLEIHEVEMMITVAGASGTTVDVGYWTDENAVGDGDGDYWFDGEAINSTGLLTSRADGVLHDPTLVTGDKNWYLVMTLAATAIAARVKIIFTVMGVYKGVG